MDTTIAISTHNRAALLRRLLGTLQRQQYDLGRLWVLVIDNASTDHTRAVVESFGGEGSRVSYAYEPRLGLSHARNRGAMLAEGEVVIFIDDDALPQSHHWARNHAQAYADPQVAAAGGDIHLAWPDGGQPPWLHDSLLPCLGQTRFGFAEPTPLHHPLCPWGGNISFRRTALLSLDAFSPQLGLAGKRHRLGEEIDVCLRLERTGRKIVYVPGAAVTHSVSAERLTDEWLSARASAQGTSRALIDAMHFSPIHRLGKGLRRCADAGVQLGALAVLRPMRERRLRLLCEYRLRFSMAYLRGALAPAGER